MSAVDVFTLIVGFVVAWVGWRRVLFHKDSMPRLVSGIFLAIVGVWLMWAAR